MKIKKKFKVILIILVLILLLVAGFVAYQKLFNKESTTTKKVVNSISEYGYKLESSDSTLYKKLYKSLEKDLNTKPVVDEDYVKDIALMFVADFYDLDNKVSKNDVGGVQFFYPSSRSNFIDKATDTIYKYVENNLYNDRTQELPKVSDVIINKVSNITYSYDNKTKTDEKAYDVVVDITYEKDLSYPKSVELIIIHDDKMLYVVEVK